MNHSYISDALAALLGIIGSFITMNLAGITWQVVYENSLNALGLGLVAAFSGLMGVVGKHAGERIIKWYKKKRSKQ